MTFKDVQGVYCARDWIRTSTSFRTPPPEDGASTSFATRAGAANIVVQVKLYRLFLKLHRQ